MSTRQTTNHHPRAGFTLVELLVVITIIGILVALLLPAIGLVRKRALQARINGEVQGVSEAVEIFKNDVSGGAYPPDAFVGEAGAVQNAVLSDFKRFFNKCFPRHREPPELIEALVGANPGGDPTDADDPNLPGGLSPAEACVFWRQKFSSDTRYPISGEGGPAFVRGVNEDLGARDWISKPDDSRLGPTDSSGAFAGRSFLYNSPIDSNVELQINLWQHFPAGSQNPLLYFDASRGIRDVRHADLQVQLRSGENLEDQTEAGLVFSIKALKPGASTGTVADIKLANEGKFQVLHAGVDEAWGEFTNACEIGPAPSSTASYPTLLLVYPSGPFTGDLADTIANFAENTTLENSQP